MAFWNVSKKSRSQEPTAQEMQENLMHARQNKAAIEKELALLDAQFTEAAKAIKASDLPDRLRELQSALKYGGCGGWMNTPNHEEIINLFLKKLHEEKAGPSYLLGENMEGQYSAAAIVQAVEKDCARIIADASNEVLDRAHRMEKQGKPLDQAVDTAMADMHKSDRGMIAAYHLAKDLRSVVDNNPDCARLYETASAMTAPRKALAQLGEEISYYDRCVTEHDTRELQSGTVGQGLQEELMGNRGREIARRVLQEQQATKRRG